MEKGNKTFSLIEGYVPREKVPIRAFKGGGKKYQLNCKFPLKGGKMYQLNYKFPLKAGEVVVSSQPPTRSSGRKRVREKICLICT